MFRKKIRLSKKAVLSDSWFAWVGIQGQRAIALACLWLVLAEGQMASWLIGGPLLLLTLWVIHRLVGQVGFTLSWWGCVRFLWYFSQQSLRAGVDVARRVLTPSLPIQAGYCRVELMLPAGPSRWLLGMVLSLLPGTLTYRLIGEEIELHCLDLSQPIQGEVESAQRVIAALFGETLRSSQSPPIYIQVKASKSTTPV